MINFKASLSSENMNSSLCRFPANGPFRYICKYYNALVGVPKFSGNEATRNAIERYLEFSVR